MYTYWQIFKQALKITWQNPHFWFFGLFAILLGSAGGLEAMVGAYGFGSLGILAAFFDGLLSGGLLSWQVLLGVYKLLLTNPLFLFLAALVVLVALALSLFVIWLTTVSQTAILGGTVSIAKNKQLGGRNEFQLGLIKFWPVLGLNLIMQIVGWLFIVITSYLANFRFTGDLLVFIVIFDILLFILLVVSFGTKYAIGGVVLRNWTFRESLSRGWLLFKNNWFVSIELAVLLLIIYSLVTLVSSFLLGTLALKALGLLAFSPPLLIIFFFVVIASFVLIQAILAVFHWAVWALVFEILMSRRIALTSVILSIFKK